MRGDHRVLPATGHDGLLVGLAHSLAERGVGVDALLALVIRLQDGLEAHAALPTSRHRKLVPKGRPGKKGVENAEQNTADN